MLRASHVILLTVLFLGGCDVFKSESDNANLASLTISNGTLSPGFSSTTTSYSVTVDPGRTTVTVSASSQKRGSSISINGERSESAQVSLSVGSNTITILVISESRKRSTTYRINVTRPQPTFAVGGSVSGLDGELTLQNNGGDNITLNADGVFEFATEIADGSDYNVTVESQPANQECTITSGTGSVSGADVTDVDVSCVDMTFSVGGTLSGLSGSITLQNNGGDDIVLTADGSFTFATELGDGEAYDVTVSSQPGGQDCSVTNGAGNIDSADVTDVAVDCATTGTLVIGGVMSGLNGLTILQLNGATDLIVVRNGIFSFLEFFDTGDDYDVTILSQPAGQTCTVTNGSGTFADDPVLDLRVDCTGAGSVGTIFDWEWINPTPFGNRPDDFATDGTTLVAVGSGGFVGTSTDGQNWIRRESGTAEALTAVEFGGGTFVAVGISGEILSSADGVTWQASERSLSYFYDVAWNGTVFAASGVAFGLETDSVVATSTDGVNWTTAVIGPVTAGGAEEIAWNGSLFIAIEGVNTYASTDGVNWTTGTVSGATFLISIASDGTRFVALDLDGTAYTSTDGVTWTASASPVPGSPVLIEWDGMRFVAGGALNYATSPDGAIWTQQFIDPMAASSLIVTAATRFNGLNVLSTNAGIYTSPDDSSWTTNYSNAFAGLWDIIWNGSQFIAGGLGASVYASADGATWATNVTPVSSQSTILGLVFAGGQYVAVGTGEGDQILTSPDAVTWTGIDLSTSRITLNNIAWADNLYVAVGANALIYTSPDGATWTAQSAGLDGDERLFDVEWINGLWVITGYQVVGSTPAAFVATSPDGQTWTKRPLPTGFGWLEGMASNGSLLVAAGPINIGTSSDGINWSIRQQSSTSFNNVDWSGTEFTLHGFGADLLNSSDGQNWTVERTLSDQIRSIASSGDTTVLVGVGGQVIRRLTL